MGLSETLTTAGNDTRKESYYSQDKVYLGYFLLQYGIGFK